MESETTLKPLVKSETGDQLRVTPDGYENYNSAANNRSLSLDPFMEVKAEPDDESYLGSFVEIKKEPEEHYKSDEDTDENCLLKFKTTQKEGYSENIESRDSTSSSSPAFKKRCDDLVRFEKAHTDKKPFQCIDCGKRFSFSSQMKRHMRTHTGEKPFVCSDCNQSFSQNPHLKMHIMRTHVGEKPFVCEVCAKKFSANSSLKDHMRTHTGEKPFDCKICNQSFSQNSSLKTHMRVHTGERPFVCKDCGKRYSHSSSLEWHLKSH